MNGIRDESEPQMVGKCGPGSLDAVLSSHACVDELVMDVAAPRGFSASSRSCDLGSVKGVVVETEKLTARCRPAQSKDDCNATVSLVFQLSGNMRIVSRSDVIDLVPGDWSLRWWDCEFIRHCFGPVQSFACALPRARLSDLAPRLERLGTVRFSSDSLETRMLTNYVRSIALEGQATSTFGITYGEALIDMIRSAIEQGYDQVAGHGSITQLSFNRIARLIGRNFSDPEFDLDDLASLAGCSKRYLHRLFKNSDFTPAAYLQNVRFQNAVMLLEQGGATVAHAAYSSGFSDPGYFSRLFRTRFGFPPVNLYRNRNF